MPAATDEAVAAFVHVYGPYRVACDGCDRDDMDGVRELPADWDEPGECQSLGEALSSYDGGPDDPAPRGYSVLDWYTHKGTCPDCQDVPVPLIVSVGVR